MLEDIFSFPISLNILIPTITASLIATLVPYTWNKQKENFQHKLKIIEEHNLLVKNFHAPLRTFFGIVNWKYREPFLENDKFVWKMRSEPLDNEKISELEGSNIVTEFNKTKRIVIENSNNRINGFLQLYRSVETNTPIDEQGDLMFQTERLLFNISYDPDQIQSIDDHLKEIESNFIKIHTLHVEILKLYMKRFRKKYWFARRIEDIKNIKK